MLWSNLLIPTPNAPAENSHAQPAGGWLQTVRAVFAADGHLPPNLVSDSPRHPIRLRIRIQPVMHHAGNNNFGPQRSSVFEPDIPISDNVKRAILGSAEKDRDAAKSFHQSKVLSGWDVNSDQCQRLVPRVCVLCVRNYWLVPPH